jgi:hypothetical protein
MHLSDLPLRFRPYMFGPFTGVGNSFDLVRDGPSRASNRLTGRSATTRRIGSSKLRSVAIGSLLLILTCTQPANADDHCGSIRGTVNTSEGIPLMGTPVAVTNQATDATISVLTNSDGSYELPRLLIGIYSLAVQAPGFQTTTIYGIRLDTNTEFTGKIEMLAGKMTSAVLLPADAVTKSRCAHKKSQVAFTTQPSSGKTSPASSPTAPH